MSANVTIKNGATATFECIYGRGCDGKCCRNGRPPVPPDEAAIIDKVLPRALPMMTPRARKLVEKEGFLSGRKKVGQPMLRVIDSWCVFFNEGCVLHKLGATDGDAYKYKPVICSLFPLDVNEKNEWYVRQWDYEDEDWDLFCLDPKATKKKAAVTLQPELKAVAAGVGLKRLD